MMNRTRSRSPSSLRNPPRRLGWCGLVLTIVGTAACAGSQMPKDAASTPGQALFNGQVRDEINCYTCHNGDGTGTWRGPNLSKRVPDLTDEQIAKAIAEGPSLMPAFKDKLTATETGEIVAWLRQRFPKKP